MSPVKFASRRPIATPRFTPSCGRGSRAPSSHVEALRRAASFAAALLCLGLPLAVASRHAEDKLTLVVQPPDFSAPSPFGVIAPLRDAASTR